MTSPVAKITEYIDHRNKREAQILQFLSTCENGVGIEAIVDGVYGVSFGFS